MDRIQKFLISDFFFLKYHAESLFFERTGIQDLVTTAGISRQRNQKIWFVKSTDLTDGVCTCAGDYHVRQGKKIRKFFFDIFILNIAFGTFEGFVHFTLAAEMDHLESFQKFRENLADMVIYRGCAKASADHHQYRFVRSKSTELTAGFLITFHQLLTDRRAGQYGFICRKTADSLRKVTAYFNG